MTGTSQQLGGNSQIEISNGAIKVLMGALSKPEEVETSIWESLLNKFTLAQKYTTVRRSFKSCDAKVLTANSVTVSAVYPDLVWRNACPEYYYQLVIDGEIEAIPAHASAEMIRHSVADLAPGVHTYKVEVLDIDGIIFSPSKDSQIIVMSAKENRGLAQKMRAQKGDIFRATASLAEKGLLVAAMDLWRSYFKKYPGENDLRPLLAESYARLRLDNLRQREARLYQSQTNE